MNAVEWKPLWDRLCQAYNADPGRSAVYYETMASLSATDGAIVVQDILGDPDNKRLPPPAAFLASYQKLQRSRRETEAPRDWNRERTYRCPACLGSGRVTVVLPRRGFYLFTLVCHCEAASRTGLTGHTMKYDPARLRDADGWTTNDAENQAQGFVRQWRTFAEYQACRSTTGGA